MSEKLEENGNEDLAESSESKNGQPDGKQDQENGVGAEKNENGGNSSAGQNTDEVSQKMPARRVRLSLKQSQRISW